MRISRLGFVYMIAVLCSLASCKNITHFDFPGIQNTLKKSVCCLQNNRAKIFVDSTREEQLQIELQRSVYPNHIATFSDCAGLDSLFSTGIISFVTIHSNGAVKFVAPTQPGFVETQTILVYNPFYSTDSTLLLRGSYTHLRTLDSCWREYYRVITLAD